jgi:hypothetical protein
MRGRGSPIMHRKQSKNKSGESAAHTLAFSLPAFNRKVGVLFD